jgi:hypothetical protein
LIVFVAWRLALFWTLGSGFCSLGTGSKRYRLSRVTLRAMRSDSSMNAWYVIRAQQPPDSSSTPCHEKPP